MNGIEMVGFQDRIIELGEPPGRLDVRWVFGDAFIALDPRERQKEIESVVQLVKSNIDCLVGLDVPAIDVLAICREEQTRLVALYQRIDASGANLARQRSDPFP